MALLRVGLLVAAPSTAHLPSPVAPMEKRMALGMVRAGFPLRHANTTTVFCVSKMHTPWRLRQRQPRKRRLALRVAAVDGVHTVGPTKGLTAAAALIRVRRRFTAAAPRIQQPTAAAVVSLQWRF